MKNRSQTLSITLLARQAIALFAFVGVISISFLSPKSSIAQTATNQAGVTKYSNHGLKLELATMPLDLVRAFFIGRGFAKTDADFIAQNGCIFRSAIGNSGVKPKDPLVTVELAKWRIIDQQRQKSPRTREDWAKIWQDRSVSQNAKVAFHWALFPSQQTYQSTDYNWGMISFALPAQTKFDLEIHWLSGAQQHKTLFKGLECGR